MSPTVSTGDLLARKRPFATCTQTRTVGSMRRRLLLAVLPALLAACSSTTSPAATTPSSTSTPADSVPTTVPGTPQTIAPQPLGSDEFPFPAGAITVLRAEDNMSAFGFYGEARAKVVAATKDALKRGGWETLYSSENGADETLFVATNGKKTVSVAVTSCTHVYPNSGGVTACAGAATPKGASVRVAFTSAVTPVTSTTAPKPLG